MSFVTTLEHGGHRHHWVERQNPRFEGYRALHPGKPSNITKSHLGADSRHRHVS